MISVVSLLVVEHAVPFHIEALGNIPGFLISHRATSMATLGSVLPIQSAQM